MEIINLKKVNASTISTGHQSQIPDFPLDSMEKLYF